MQFLGGFFPLLKKNYPILPVRIAECMLGKTTPSQIFIVIPAHLFGGLLGIVFFRSIFPFIPNKVCYHNIQLIMFSFKWN